MWVEFAEYILLNLNSLYVSHNYMVLLLFKWSRTCVTNEFVISCSVLFIWGRCVYACVSVCISQLLQQYKQLSWVAVWLHWKYLSVKADGQLFSSLALFWISGTLWWNQIIKNSLMISIFKSGVFLLGTSLTIQYISMIRV